MKQTATATFLLATFLANLENKQTFVKFNSQEELDRIFDIIKTEKIKEGLDFINKPLKERVPFPLFISFGLRFGTNLSTLIDGRIVPSEILVANTQLKCTCDKPKQVLKSVEITPDLLESLLIDALGLNPENVEESLLLVINEQRKEIESQSDIIEQWKNDSEVFMGRVELLMELREKKKQA
jgi:hypothetical protein